MKKKYFKLPALLISAAVIVASCGSSTAQKEDATAASNDTTNSSAETDEGHSHSEILEVPEGMEVPTVEIEVTEDAKAGHNVFVDIKNFTIAPESASSEPVDGEGHLHLYIDGKLTQRFYNTALHLDGLEAGEHTIEVGINANNHSAYAVDGEAIRASETITVKETNDKKSTVEIDPVEVDAANAPTVDIDVTADPKSGWNVKVDLENYTLAPKSAGGENVDGEGHLNLTINDAELTRLYGQWWHINQLVEGTNDIEVTLNANNHAPYALNGEIISASQQIEVTAEQASTGHHGMGDDDEGGHETGHHKASGKNVLDIAADDADTVIEVTIKDGEVTTTPESPIKVEKGSSVGIKATSDIEEEVHVHLYDVLAEVAPDKDANFAFTADVDGKIEVELEKSATLLFNLQVS